MSESPMTKPESDGSGTGGLRRVLQWIPLKARLAVCCGLLVLVPLAVHSYLSNGHGDINLICRHNLQSAELTVSIDGKLAFTESSSGKGLRGSYQVLLRTLPHSGDMAELLNEHTENQNVCQRETKQSTRALRHP